MMTSLLANRLDTPHILLVDDNRNGLIVRKALLEEQGFAVATASNAEEGLELFASACFDVIVTDFKMPRMNGTELIQRIRQTCPNARIILLSGFVEPLGLTEQTTGADVVLAKTANEPTQLVRSVKRLLNGGTTRKPPATQTAALRAKAAKSIGS
jgi:CheY-like chemotaxis protein